MLKVGEDKRIVEIFSKYDVKCLGNDPTSQFPRACLWLDNTPEAKAQGDRLR